MVVEGMSQKMVVISSTDMILLQTQRYYKVINGLLRMSKALSEEIGIGKEDILWGIVERFSNTIRLKSRLRIWGKEYMTFKISKYIIKMRLQVTE